MKYFDIFEFVKLAEKLKEKREFLLTERRGREVLSSISQQFEKKDSRQEGREEKRGGRFVGLNESCQLSLSLSFSFVETVMTWHLSLFRPLGEG
jgi:hypothetical protein